MYCNAEVEDAVDSARWYCSGRRKERMDVARGIAERKGNARRRTFCEAIVDISEVGRRFFAHNTPNINLDDSIDNRGRGQKKVAASGRSSADRSWSTAVHKTWGSKSLANDPGRQRNLYLHLVTSQCPHL